MDVTAILDRIQRRRDFAGQLEHVEVLPERASRFDAISPPLPSSLTEVLATRSIRELYSHQAMAIAGARKHFVVVTGTASGKTLCYNLPILESVLADSRAKAICLYPTKALAQDQLKGVQELISSNSDLVKQVRPGVYDGDTPTAQRRRIRNEANIVMSNPDMLHASILPYHPKWADFFTDLRLSSSMKSTPIGEFSALTYPPLSVGCSGFADTTVAIRSLSQRAPPSRTLVN